MSSRMIMKAMIAFYIFIFFGGNFLAQGWLHSIFCAFFFIKRYFSAVQMNTIF